MQCDQVRAALGHDENAEVREHLEGCAACRQYARDLRDLGTLLDADRDQPVGLGFDTRFFARLEEEKRRGRRGVLGWVFAGAAAAAVAAVVGVVLLRPGDELEGADLELALHLDVLEDLEMLRQLEEVEAFELLAGVEDFEALVEQGG